MESQSDGDLEYSPILPPDQRDMSSSAEKRRSRKRSYDDKRTKKITVLLKKCMQSKNTRLLVGLFLGQLLSLLLCGTGVTSQVLFTNFSVQVPATQAFVSYVFLGFVYGSVMASRSSFWTVFRKNWWKYVFLGVVDVEANYLIIMAYKYTNLTSIQLLDSFTIVSVMILSFIFLRIRFKIINFMGVSLSLIGILSLVLADIRGSRAGRGTNPLLGDLLCLAGAVLYAVSNVAQEFLVKNHSVVEYLAFIGVSGSIVSAIQLYVLELKDLVQVEWNLNICLLLIGFGFFSFVFYSITPHLLKLTSAVVFNLSLLTADFYTLIFGLFLFHYKFSFFYVLAFILIVLGVFIYNLKLPSSSKKKKGSESTKKKKKNGKDGGGKTQEADKSHKLVTQLRRALLESQTVQISSSREMPGANKANVSLNLTSTSPPTLSNGKSTSKLPSKLPSKLAVADMSAVNAGGKGMTTLPEVEMAGGTQEGLISGRRSSSSSERGSKYGSVESIRQSKDRTSKPEIKVIM